MGVIIYSARTGRLRRTITDDVQTDDELLPIHAPGLGELAHLGAPVRQEELSAITGIVPADDRYVAVQTSDGVVKTFLIADPSCGDSVAGCVLVAHAIAQIDWRQALDGSFQRSLLEIDEDLARQNGLLTGPLSSRERYISNPNHARGKTDAEIDAALAAERAAATAALVTLNAERAARSGPR